MAAAGETATVSLSGTEGRTYGSLGGVSHSVYVTGSAFVVPATNGTVTIITKTASL
jgi:hypothetical protein